jgi:catechol 2,3-dioxygenase-like lactoylglutathione lyase family enzyme
MTLVLSHCTLAVDDLAEALHFYGDVLGFKVRDDVEFEGQRWVSVSPPAQPDLQIVLAPPAPPGRLVFVTDDCDAIFEHLEAAGAEVMQEPINQPFGARDCAFADPSGNLLRFSQPPL